MTAGEYRMRVKIWLYQGKGTWYLVTLPKKQADHIRSHFGWRRKSRRGWGSIRVTAAIGKTTWETSIFPDGESGSYLMPLKKEVRAAENLQAGKTVVLSLKISLPPASLP